VIREMKNAVLARLRADSELASVVFEGVVTNRPNRYVAVFSDSGWRTAERFTGAQSTSAQSFTVHSVGTTPDQAQFVADRVFTQLLDWTPSVAGRVCRRMRHEASEPVQIDADVTPPLFYAVDVFEVTSSPA
jgi:hypothetical protein